MKQTISVGLVGLGFGAEFVPLYLNHPKVDRVVLCDADPDVLSKIGQRFGVQERCQSFSEVLSSPDLDAIHLVTPIPLHAEQTLAVLRSGKHCACTVPMAVRIKDLRDIIRASKEMKRSYMMMETAVYSREFLYVRQLYEKGELGRIQFLRGAHYQDMERWPPYWMGLPPMHYATHAIAPILSLSDSRAVHVHCLGSGVMRSELRRQYRNPFPIETAIFRLATEDLSAEVSRSLFHTARSYMESFYVYGEKASFEWQQREDENPVVFKMEEPAGRRGRPVSSRRIDVPDRQDLLPEEIARFTRKTVYDPEDPHRSFLQGGGHGGSHPHLVHEFVSSLVEGRAPAIDAVTAADWTAAGLCAHASALRSGKRITIPRFG
jgi:predicted dehydrogenase